MSIFLERTAWKQHIILFAFFPSQILKICFPFHSSYSSCLQHGVYVQASTWKRVSFDFSSSTVVLWAQPFNPLLLLSLRALLRRSVPKRFPWFRVFGSVCPQEEWEPREAELGSHLFCLKSLALPVSCHLSDNPFSYICHRTVNI